MKQKQSYTWATAGLAALLVLTLAGCSGADKAPASSVDASSDASTVLSVPKTDVEIVRHNDQINPDDVKLIQLEAPAADAQQATIKTTLGEIKLVLYPAEAPLAVKNFTELVQDGFYNGMKFYEVFPDTRIGAGATDANATMGKSASGNAFADEYSLNLWHFNGAIAMNNGSVPGANDSRFYIVQNTELAQETADAIIDGGFPQKVIDQYLAGGGLPACDFRDTVFGQVVEGLDVVEKIALSERDDQNKPTTDVVIESIILS